MSTGQPFRFLRPVDGPDVADVPGQPWLDLFEFTFVRTSDGQHFVCLVAHHAAPGSDERYDSLLIVEPGHEREDGLVGGFRGCALGHYNAVFYQHHIPPEMFFQVVLFDTAHRPDPIRAHDVSFLPKSEVDHLLEPSLFQAPRLEHTMRHVYPPVPGPL